MITDRTEEDVLMGRPKGFFGASDLNRIEGAVAVVAGRFPELGMGKTLTVKTDWGSPGDYSPEAWPGEKQMGRFLENLRFLREAFHVETALPESMEKLTWRGANALEAVAEQAMARSREILNNFSYSGEIYAGEVSL